MPPVPWTTCSAVRIWPCMLTMTPDPRAVSWGWPTAADSITTISGRTEEKMPTPGGGRFFRLLTAAPTLVSAILPTSALLTDGLDELCTVAQTRTPTAIAPTTPRMIQIRRRQAPEPEGGTACLAESTPPDTSVGGAPYLIASTYS